jgi:hypothetical protein
MSLRKYGVYSPNAVWFSVPGSEFRVKSFQPETLNSEPGTSFQISDIFDWDFLSVRLIGIFLENLF